MAAATDWAQSLRAQRLELTCKPNFLSVSMTFDLNLLIKIMTWMASPLGIFCAGAVVTLLLTLTNWTPKLRVWLMVLVSAQLVFFSLPIVAASLHQALEERAQDLVTQRVTNRPYAAALLLGGVGRPFSETEKAIYGDADFGDAIDRALYAAELYEDGTVPRIIVTGGNWRLQDTDRPSEAIRIRDLLLELGVKPEDILIEERSRTTRENFIYTDALMKQHNLQGPIALVTSATHMPRAMRNASTMKFDVDPFPTDWRSIGLSLQATPWLPSADGLLQSEIALKEWLAALVSY